MYIVQIKQGDGTWITGSTHTELKDALDQQAIYLSMGFLTSALKIVVQQADGSYADYVP